MTIDSFTTPEEVWRWVVGYEGVYKVSSTGQVARWLPQRNTYSGRILKLSLTNFGYLRVCLTKDGVPKKYFVHRLVAAAFLDEVPEKKFVNHIDGNKTNNRVENLEYVTCKENQAHASRMGLSAKGDRSSRRLYPERYPVGRFHHKAKLTESDILRIRALIAEGVRHKQIASEYGVTRALISTIGRREIWTHV